MSKISCSQFIYGKLSRGLGEYQIVGHTQDLNNLSELQNLLKKYKFWGMYPPEKDRRAVGVFPYQDKWAVFVQVGPATGTNIARRFDQYRYVFIPFEELEKIGYRTEKLLRYFLKKSIPVLDKFKSNLERFDIDILGQKNPEEEREKERELVKECLKEIDDEGNYFLISSISVIISSISTGKSKRRLLINNISNSLAGEKFYLQSILLLLPAICRKEVSIAVGNLEERDFDWAKLMIKTIDSQSIRRDRLPKNCVWLDRQRQELVGLSDSDRFQSKYVDKLRKFIEERQGDIGQLIEQLDRVNDPSVTLESLIADPDNVFRQVPLLYDRVLQIITILQSYPNTASWADLAGKECQLQFDIPEDIEHKIKQLNSGKCKFAEVLLYNLSSAKNKLAEFAKLTQEEQGLTLTALIDYIDDCPDVLDDFKKFAYKLEPEKSQWVKFIDEILGSQDKFLTGVLRVWFDWIAEERNQVVRGQLRKNFLKPSFAWNSFQAQPKKYIRELLSENKLREPNTIIAAFQCLVELDSEHFDLIRTDLLKYLKECWESDRAGEQDRSSSYDNIIVQVASNGNAASLKKEDWDILAPILLHSNFSANIDPLVANLKELPSEDRQISREYLVTSALEIVEKLNSSAETESLLNNCKLWEFSQNELTQVLDAIVERTESVPEFDDRLDVEFILNYIPRQSLKLHNIEEQRQIYNLLFRVRPSTGEQRESYGVFVNILRDLVLAHQYQILKQWRNEFYTQKYGRDFYSDFYSNDFMKAIDDLLEISTGKVESILKDIQEDDLLKHEYTLLKNRYSRWLNDRLNGIGEKSPQQQREELKAQVEALEAKFSEHMKQVIEEVKSPIEALDREFKAQGEELKSIVKQVEELQSFSPRIDAILSEFSNLAAKEQESPSTGDLSNVENAENTADTPADVEVDEPDNPSDTPADAEADEPDNPPDTPADDPEPDNPSDTDTPADDPEPDNPADTLAGASDNPPSKKKEATTMGTGLLSINRRKITQFLNTDIKELFQQTDK